MQSLKIDPSLFKEDDVEILEDLIVAAHKDAKDKADHRRCLPKRPRR
jgi:DNA-binding protein YbaB